MAMPFGAFWLAPIGACLPQRMQTLATPMSSPRGATWAVQRRRDVQKLIAGLNVIHI